MNSIDLISLVILFKYKKDKRNELWIKNKYLLNKYL